jgi:hypothetical protein
MKEREFIDLIKSYWRRYTDFHCSLLVAESSTWRSARVLDDCLLIFLMEEANLDLRKKLVV